MVFHHFLIVFALLSCGKRDPLTPADLESDTVIMIHRSGDFYAINPESKKEALLFTTEDEHFSWSPNGKKILYGFPPRFVVGIRNNDRIPLNNIKLRSHTTWAWDSNSLIAVQDSLVYQIDTSTGGRTLLLPSSNGVPKSQRASISPDRTRIVIDAHNTKFPGCGDCLGPVYIVDIDGSNLTELDSEGNLDLDQPFSPDGRHLLTTRNVDAAHTIRLFGLDPIESIGFAVAGLQGTWCPNGDFVAFVRQRECGFKSEVHV
jgi:Tol biopolymer transport system component